MQCNPQLPFFVSGPPNCSQFYPCPQNFNQPQLQPLQPPCSPAQYPGVIGEGEVVSVVLADGTVQLYFMPNWTTCMNNTNYNQGWNQNAGAWFVRSINSPQCPRFPPQNNMPCGALDYSCNTPALPPCQGFQMKFHNDQCTSTGDIEYFFPRLRTCDVTPRACAGVQAAVPEKTCCFGMVCDAPCLCRADCSGTRRPVYTGHVSYGDIKYDSDMSIEETREKTSRRGSKRRKGQTDCECHRDSSNSSEGKDRKRQKKSNKKTETIKNSFSQTSSTENCQSSGRKHKPCKNLDQERKAWEKERKKQQQERNKQEKEFEKKVKELEKKGEKVRLDKKREKKEQGKISASSQSDDEFDEYSDSCTCSVCTSSVCRTMSGLSGSISCSDSFISLDSKNSESQEKVQKQREKEQRKINKEQEKKIKKEQKQLEKAQKEQEKKFKKQLHLKKKKDSKEDRTRKDGKDSIEDGKKSDEGDSSMSLDSKNSDSQEKVQKQREKEQRKINKEQEKKFKKEQKQLEKAQKEQKKFKKQLHLKKNKDSKEDKTRKDSKDSIEDGKNGDECSCFAPLPVDDCAHCLDSPMFFDPNTNTCNCCDTGLKIVDCIEGMTNDVGSLCVCPPTSDKIMATHSELSNNSIFDIMMKGLAAGIQSCMPPDKEPCCPSCDYISCNSNHSISPNIRPV